LAYLQEARQSHRKPSIERGDTTGAAGDAIRLENQLCFALYAASRAMTNAYRPILSGLDLTYPQYLVMLALWEQDNVTISSLGDRLYLDFGTLTPLLRRLEDRNLVVRKRDRIDERHVKIILTRQGRSLRKSAADVPKLLRCRIQLTRQQTASLRHDLRLLLEALSA
jgi:MarR family transcriptional regulator, organic hydroperoxide resistance regulator